MAKIKEQTNVVKIESHFNTVNVWKRINNDKKCESYNLNNYYYVDDTSGEYETIFGQKVKKIYKDKNNDKVSGYEDDLDLGEHFSITLARNNLLARAKKYRVMHFDIETQGSIDTINTPVPVISLTTYDTFTKEFKFFVCLSGSKKDTQMKHVSSAQHEFFETEKEMLSAFCVYMKKFDIITAWNGIKFDFPYLINRCKKIGVNIQGHTSKFASGGNGRFKDKSIKSVIYGLNVVDLLVVFMKVVEWLPKKPVDYRLDTIAKTFLKDTQKIQLNITPGELWKQGRYRELKEYNIADVNVMVELDKKFGLIQFLQNTQELVPALNIEEVPYNSKIIDFYLLSKYNKVFPGKRFGLEKTFVVTGAQVLDPIAGFHKWVGVLDFSGMYQNIIRTFNISPDTIVDDGDIILNDTKFTSHKIGLLTQLVTDLINKRAEIVKIKMSYEGKDEEMLQLYFYKECMIKKITNSVYGVFAYSNFRLFDPRVANAITFIGRELIGYIEEMSKKHGFRVIYGDTDSVFITNTKYTTNTTESSVIIDMTEFTNKLNLGLTEFCKKYTSNIDIPKNHTLKINFETLFQEMVMTDAKKRYAGYVVRWKNAKLQKPKLYYHGIELSRKDTPIAIKQIIESIVCDVFEHKLTDKEMKEKLNTAKKLLRQTPVRELMVHKNLTAEINDYKVMPQHARAAKYSNEHLGTNFSKENYKGGMLYVKVKAKYPQTDVVLLEPETQLPPEIIINYSKYEDMFIDNKMKLIFGEKYYNEHLCSSNLMQFLC